MGLLDQDKNLEQLGKEKEENEKSKGDKIAAAVICAVVAFIYSYATFDVKSSILRESTRIPEAIGGRSGYF